MRPAPDTKTDEPCFTAGTVRFFAGKRFHVSDKITIFGYAIMRFPRAGFRCCRCAFRYDPELRTREERWVYGLWIRKVAAGNPEDGVGNVGVPDMSWLFYGAAVVEVFPGHGPEFVKRRGEPNGGGRTIDNGKTGAGLRCRSLDVGDRLGGWTENESDSDGLLPSGRVEMVRETGGMENEDVVSGRWMHCFPERVEVFGPVRRRGGTECPLFF